MIPSPETDATQNDGNKHKKSRFPTDISLGKSESGCTYGENCRFRLAEVDRQSSEKSKKSGVKGSIAFLKESIDMGCVSQDSQQDTPLVTPPPAQCSTCPQHTILPVVRCLSHSLSSGHCSHARLHDSKGWAPSKVHMHPSNRHIFT